MFVSFESIDPDPACRKNLSSFDLMGGAQFFSWDEQLPVQTAQKKELIEECVSIHMEWKMSSMKHFLQ